MKSFVAAQLKTEPNICFQLWNHKRSSQCQMYDKHCCPQKNKKKKKKKYYKVGILYKLWFNLRVTYNNKLLFGHMNENGVNGLENSFVLRVGDQTCRLLMIVTAQIFVLFVYIPYCVHICFLHDGSAEHGGPWRACPICQRWPLSWVILLFRSTLLLTPILTYEKVFRNVLLSWQTLPPPSCLDFKPDLWAVFSSFHQFQ